MAGSFFFVLRKKKATVNALGYPQTRNVAHHMIS